MKRMKSSSPLVTWAAIAALAAVCLALPAVATAQTVAEMRAASAGVDFHPVVEYGAMVLTVSAPDGTVYTSKFGAGESPFFSIFDKAGGVLPDGAYNYELRVAPTNTQRREALEANQAATKGRAIEEVVQSGTFTIVGGAVVSGGTEPGAGAKVAGNSLSTKDQVIPDDLIVQGSLCVGFDCVNNESFGFDTIRLKENNTRIKFDDTSTGTFPTNDWQLTANDSASGGANKFSIDDVTNAKTPFTVEGNSPTNSIFVDSTGRVGFRTSTPVLDLHVSTSNSPALRLEQTSAGGFTAQTWDIAGNEANFFVRDVTSGSKLPFRIRPGAPTSSIDIAANGNVGIGTASPSTKLHLKGVDTAGVNSLKINFENSGTSTTWFFQNDQDNTFKISRDGTGGPEVTIDERLDANGATLKVDGSVQATNVTFSSSRALKTGFVPVDAKDVLAKVTALPLSEWQFKAEEHPVRHLGPIAEDFWGAFALGSDDRHISVTDLGGVSLAAIQGLNEVVEQKDQEIQELRSRLEELETLVHQLGQKD